MDEFSSVTVQLLEIGRWREIGSLRGFSVGVFVRLAGLLAGLLRVCPLGGGWIKPRLQLGESCFPFVQLSVQNAHLP